MLILKNHKITDLENIKYITKANFDEVESKKLTLDDCGKLATKSASHIIKQYGARPVESLSKLLIT